MERSAAAPRRYTIEQYAALEEPDDIRSDLVRGLLVREPRPSLVHGIVQGEIARVLGNHVKERSAGYVVTESGVILGRRPPTVRGPDVAFYAAGRFGDALPSPFVEGPPDLAVEVLSPSDTAARFQGKVMDYLEAGTPLLWVIDPQGRTATVYSGRSDVRLLREDDALEGADVLPGFSVRVGELFPF